MLMNEPVLDDDLPQVRAKLLGSLLLFTQVFFEARTGRPFELSSPSGRESHFISMCKSLKKVFNGEVSRQIIAIPPRYAKCLDPETDIYTTKGLIKAKNVRPGDILYSHDEGRLVMEPCLAIERAYKKAMKIKMRSGRELICSYDHPMLTTHGYKQVKDIKVGERIKALKAIVNGDIRINHDELTFISLMIFDGCCRKKLGFTKEEKFVVDLFYKTCENLDIQVKHYESDRPFQHSILGGNSSNARKLLIKYGINNQKSYDKRIPSDWFAMPLDQKLWFIDLMFATDGYVNKKNGTCGVTLANKGLITDIQHMLSTIGIISTMSYVKNDCANAWRLTVGREGTHDLLKKISFTYKRKNAELALEKFACSSIDTYPNSILKELKGQKARKIGIRIDNDKDVSRGRFDKLCSIFPLLEKHRNYDFYLDEVISIEELQEQELIHLEVNKTHNFIANGLVSHNTETLIHFIAWSLAKYPDSKFIYVSCEKGLATLAAQTIREIIRLPLYQHIFATRIKEDTSAKHNFHTEQGGAVYAVGAGGMITGRGAGVKNVNRFGGCIVIDDILKPDEAMSDLIREARNFWFYNTLQSRLNNAAKTPIILIGQRLHEDDLQGSLMRTNNWSLLSLPALDENNNALYPEQHTTEMLLKLKQEEPYTFAAQYQQDPQPAGGGIFKPEWFVLMDEEPNIISTFITVDTAETDKNYNDATVFSFWGLYLIKQSRYEPFRSTVFAQRPDDIETNMYGVHWIDCYEFRVEPKDLYPYFMDFYAGCMRHTVKPTIAAIEKKSTGVTMASILSGMQGLCVLDIDRTIASGSKAARFLKIQPYIATKRISLPRNGKHTQMCINHCSKLTINNSHRFDDVGDTLVDSVTVALIDEIIPRGTLHEQAGDKVLNQLVQHNQYLQQLKSKAYATRPI